MREIS